MNRARATIDQVIAMLDSANQRQAMYFSPVDVSRVEHWLAGVRAGLAVAGIQWNTEFRRAPLSRRGLELMACFESSRLAERGMSEPEIVSELLEIEIEMWQANRDALV